MGYLLILGKGITSIVVLFILSKVMGRKQVSQLNVFDYIIGISIGSIAAEMTLNNDIDSLALVILDSKENMTVFEKNMERGVKVLE